MQKAGGFLSDFDLAKKVKGSKLECQVHCSNQLGEGLIQGYDVLGLEEAVIRGWEVSTKAE